jgi:hypothetical protein
MLLIYGVIHINLVIVIFFLNKNGKIMDHYFKQHYKIIFYGFSFSIFNY